MPPSLALGLGYLHLVHPPLDPSGTPEVLKAGTARQFRTTYGGRIIANGGFNFDRANEAISGGDADLVSFAKLYLANPERFATEAALSEPNPEAFYQGGSRSYIDYPKLR